MKSVRKDIDLLYILMACQAHRGVRLVAIVVDAARRRSPNLHVDPRTLPCKELKHQLPFKTDESYCAHLIDDGLIVLIPILFFSSEE